ncbi:MAG: hypothetical protein SV253_02990 [Halobacteria archaeon]|nr:hypothetical protein [Halobacteria archaeon]
MNKEKVSVVAVIGVIVVVGVVLLSPADPSEKESDIRSQNQSESQIPDESPTGAQTGEEEVRDGSGEASVEFRIETSSIESCGTTCRDVTSTLYNTGDADAHSVEVSTSIYSGGDLVWEGRKTVGDLKAGDSYTTTQRVDVGLGGGMKIRSNDGLITIETEIESDEERVVFTEERDVA